MKEYGQIVTLRIPQQLLTEINDAINSRRTWQKRKRWSWHAGSPHEDGRSAWILRAVREKLAKLLRGRRPRRKSAHGDYFVPTAEASVASDPLAKTGV